MRYCQEENQSVFLPESAAEIKIVKDVLSGLLEMECDLFSIWDPDYALEGPWFTASAVIPAHWAGASSISIERPPPTILVVRLALPTEYGSGLSHVCKLGPETTAGTIDHLVACLSKHVYKNFTSANYMCDRTVFYVKQLCEVARHITWARGQPTESLRRVRQGKLLMSQPDDVVESVV